MRRARADSEKLRTRDEQNHDRTWHDHHAERHFRVTRQRQPHCNNIKEAKMSDIFSGIQYIPLETKSECLIGYMDIVSFDNEVIIRSHGNNSIYRFTDQGKFINKIGNHGRGPAEYQDYSDVRLFNDTVFVSSLFTGSVITYTLNGKFLKRYELGTGAQPKSMIQLQDKSFMIVSNNQGGIVNLFKTDNWFNIKERLSISFPLKGNPLPYGFQQSANKSYFYYNFSDTIYYVSEDNLTPKFIMEFNKYKTGKEKLSMDAKESIVLNKPSLSSFYASNDYLKFEISYPYKKSIYALLYRISDSKQSSWSNLINDLDNGILGAYNRLFENCIRASAY